MTLNTVECVFCLIANSMEKGQHDLPSDVEADGPLNHRQTNSEPQGGKPTATVRPANGTESHRCTERGIFLHVKEENHINSYLYMFPRPHRK